MMAPIIELVSPTRADVVNMAQWLQDDEVNQRWLGRFPDGEPVHLGYLPVRMLEASQEEWDRVFLDERRNIFSIYAGSERHIGEAHMVVEGPLQSAELAVLIGPKDLWGQGYGTVTVRELLRMVFEVHGLARAWVDIPADNIPGLRVCRKLGFLEEGRLRGSRPRGAQRIDSIVMGMLASDYANLSRVDELLRAVA